MHALNSKSLQKSVLQNVQRNYPEAVNNMTLISNSCRKNPRFAKIELMSRYGVLFQSKQGPNIDFQSRRQQLCCRWPLLAWHCCNHRQKPCQLEVVIRPKKAPWKLESGKARGYGRVVRCPCVQCGINYNLPKAVCMVERMYMYFLASELSHHPHHIPLHHKK